MSLLSLRLLAVLLDSFFIFMLVVCLHPFKAQPQLLRSQIGL